MTASQNHNRKTPVTFPGGPVKQHTSNFRLPSTPGVSSLRQLIPNSLSLFSRLSACFTLLVLLVGASALRAQFETASVLGYVRDTSGAPIANSTVTLLNVATGVSVVRTSDDQGHFEFVDVHVAQYKVRAAAGGFVDTESETFMVNVNARQRVDLTLK